MGRRRKVLPASAIPLVGGALCLDLVNTTGARATGAPRERLSTDADLRTWARRAGLSGGATLERTRELRELLYAVFRPIAEGTAPRAEVLSQLGTWWRAERSRRELVLRDGVYELQLRPDPETMLWPIVASAVEVLTSSEHLRRLKKCAECDWLFLDESKNGSRTWCKRDCGNRARARRRYARVRLQPRRRA